MSTYRDQAIVLRTRVRRDADREYTLYTAHHGKVVVLAKGVRRGKSKMSPHLGSFGVVDVMIARGRMIDRLAGVNLIQSFRLLRESFEKSAAASSTLLVVDAMVKRELPDERLFLLLQSYLGTLAVSAPLTARTLFGGVIMKLLDSAGVSVELDVCVGCRKPLIETDVQLNLLRGGVECDRCIRESAFRISSDSLKVLRFLRRESFATIERLHISTKLQNELSMVVDLMLSGHLELAFAPLGFLKLI